MDVREARSRDDALHVDASVLFNQGAGERLFVGVARCEVDVSAFRRARHQPPIDPRQQSDAEAGARGNQRDAALSVGASLVEHFDLVSRENRNRPRERFEIVQQVGARNRHLTSQRVEVHDPWHVRQLRARAGDRACDAEARGLDVGRVRRRLAKKLQTQRAEIGEVERAVGARLGGVGRPAPRRKRPRNVFVPPTSPASSIARRLYGARVLDFYSPLLHLSRLRSREMQASYGERAVARPCRAEAGPNHDPESPELPLADQLVVFTGKLSSLGRKEAQALVIRLGGSTADEVTARTTLVVVGAEAGPNAEKSQKQRKAEDLGVRVITENDFCRMAGIQPPEDLKQQYYGQRDLLSMYHCRAPGSAKTIFGICRSGA